jgi:tRNA dimethylallyltransferase
LAAAEATVIAVVGPTAVGKTAFAVRLAQRIGGEIVSADSVQVYRGLDIGSAKPTLAERGGVPHHLIDVVDPATEALDAHRFGQLAWAAIADIAGRGRPVVLVGGTGLYVRAALQEWTFEGPEPDPALRAALMRLPNEELFERLLRLDPTRAQRIGRGDRPRLIRALEGGGRGGARPSPYRIRRVFLWRPRAELYRRIEARARAHWHGGLLGEARPLLALPIHHPVRRALGYREALWYWRGLVTSDEGLRLVIRNTRHFAKRQMTWWRRDPDLLRVEAGTRAEDEAIEALAVFAGGLADGGGAARSR